VEDYLCVCELNFNDFVHFNKDDFKQDFLSAEIIDMESLRA
jgi:hypothetical protein